MSMTRELALCHIAALKQQPEQSGAYLGSSAAERLTVNQVVAGSIPALDANTTSEAETDVLHCQAQQAQGQTCRN